MHKNSLNNLKKPTSDEAKNLGKIGGQKSGIVKRQRKMIKEYINQALNADIQSRESVNLLSGFLPNIPENEQNILLLSVVKIIKDLISNDVKPLERLKILEFLRDTVGEKPIDNLKIDNNTAEAFEIDKRLAKMSDEELKAMLYGKTALEK